MITREKLQGWIDQNAGDSWGSDMSTNDETEVLNLALAHLDSTRARRVGEAVIAEFNRCNAEGLRFGGGALYEIVEQALRGEP